MVASPSSSPAAMPATVAGDLVLPGALCARCELSTGMPVWLACNRCNRWRPSRIRTADGALVVADPRTFVCGDALCPQLAGAAAIRSSAMSQLRCVLCGCWRAAAPFYPGKGNVFCCALVGCGNSCSAGPGAALRAIDDGSAVPLHEVQRQLLRQRRDALESVPAASSQTRGVPNGQPVQRRAPREGKLRVRSTPVVGVEEVPGRANSVPTEASDARSQKEMKMPRTSRKVSGAGISGSDAGTRRAAHAPVQDATSPVTRQGSTQRLDGPHGAGGASTSGERSTPAHAAGLDRTQAVAARKRAARRGHFTDWVNCDRCGKWRRVSKRALRKIERQPNDSWECANLGDGTTCEDPDDVETISDDEVEVSAAHDITIHVGDKRGRGAQADAADDSGPTLLVQIPQAAVLAVLREMEEST